ncbi:PIP5K3 [Symbiodinium sp. CCMP2592]|nr:PIP5K3 [Symbiodinium sp. CCMP2592]
MFLLFFLLAFIIVFLLFLLAFIIVFLLLFLMAFILVLRLLFLLCCVMFFISLFLKLFVFLALFLHFFILIFLLLPLILFTGLANPFGRHLRGSLLIMVAAIFLLFLPLFFLLIPCFSVAGAICVLASSNPSCSLRFRHHLMRVFTKSGVSNSLYRALQQKEVARFSFDWICQALSWWMRSSLGLLSGMAKGREGFTALWCKKPMKELPLAWDPKEHRTMHSAHTRKFRARSNWEHIVSEQREKARKLGRGCTIALPSKLLGQTSLNPNLLQDLPSRTKVAIRLGRYGVYKAANGNIVYEGQFNNDRMDGEGTYHFSDGRVYVGAWQKGHMCGKGAMTWPDGSRYEGEYKNDFRHGQGTLTWPDGRKYEGQWANGKQDGEGVMIDSLGNATKSRWRNGSPIED